MPYGLILQASIMLAILLVSWYWLKTRLAVPKPRNGANEPDQPPLMDRIAIPDGVAVQDKLRNRCRTWSQIDNPSCVICPVESDQISWLFFVAHGRLVTISSHANHRHEIRIWAAEDRQLKEMRPSLEHGDGAAITSIATSRDGRYITSGDQHGRVIIWDAETYPFRKIGEVAGAGRKITALDLSSDSLRVASGSENGQVFIWCMKKRECLMGPLNDSYTSAVTSVKFSPVGSRIASAGSGKDSRILIWHSWTGAQLGSLPSIRSQSLTWSADGLRLFFGGSWGSFACFDVTCSHLSEWDLLRRASRYCISSLCLTRNGRFLVSTASYNQRGTPGLDIIEIWNCPTSTPFFVQSQNYIHITSVSPENTHLATIESESKDEGKKIVIRSLSSVIDESPLDCHLSPLSQDQKPFMCMSDAVYEAWTSASLQVTEEVLSMEIKDHNDSDFIRYQFANRALVRVRRGNWDGALEDVEAATALSESPIPSVAYVAKGLALHGLGDTEQAMLTFRSVLSGCDGDVDVKRFVECIKFIAIPTTSLDLDDNLPETNLSRLVKAWHYLRAVRIMDKRDHKKTLELLDRIPDLGPLLHVPEIRTLSLIFDWDLHRLICDIHKLRCEALFESSLPPCTLNYFSAKGDDLSEALEAVTAELSSLSERFGDEASHERAIEWYREALVLTGCPLDVARHDPVDRKKVDATLQRLASLRRCPQCVVHLLAKRSARNDKMGLRENALTDAQWATGIDPSHPLGHFRSYRALYALGHHKEACTALRKLSEIGSCSYDSEIAETKYNYKKTLKEAQETMKMIFKESPFVLINVQDGRLYDQKGQKDRFMEDPIFYELVSTMAQATKPDVGKIKKVVKNYFLYVMLSHRWEPGEPLYQDILGKSVYDTQFEKLRTFCEVVRKDARNFRWSWNDTCCIDKKADKKDIDKSIHSMYKWYGNSALTLVLLTRPKDSSKPTIEDNEWMERAWTLQELLAPKVVQFYDRAWKLYLDDNTSNHKESPKIKAELARYVTEDTLSRGALGRFDPDDLSVRERLRLASNREAQEELDRLAYSLIGIFKSDILVDYALPAETAFGRLLEEIVNRYEAVTVLDWFGKPSTFHSSLPADISVYSDAPYTLPSITEDDLEQRVQVLSQTLQKHHVNDFYTHLTGLRSPKFATRVLELPCVTFSVTHVEPATRVSGGAQTYVASTAALGTFEFTTDSDLFSSGSWRRANVVLAYPWHVELLDRINRLGGDDYTKALRALVYLERGFTALLFAKPADSRKQVWYRRVGAERQILIPARELINWEGIGAEVLRICE